MAYYAVAKGKETGIFEDWDSCRNAVHGYSGAKYKKFKTKEEAEEYMEKNSRTVIENNVVVSDSVLQERERKEELEKIKDEKASLVMKNRRDIKKIERKIKALEIKVDALENKDLINERAEIREKEKRVIGGFEVDDIKYYTNEAGYISLEDIIKIFSNQPVQEGIDDIDTKADIAIAYVDGSFSAKEKRFGYGVVLFYDDKKYTYKGYGDEEQLLDMHNVSGELKASIISILAAISKGAKRIIIHYDYQGIEKWAKNKWKAKKNGTKAYKQFIKAMSKLIKIDFIKVKAHTGDKYNEEADDLATQGIRLKKEETDLEKEN